jgi:hypothetical protein
MTNHENWRRLGWYMSPLGVWLGVLGCCSMLWRGNRRMIPFLGLGLLFSTLYLWNVSANPHHVYVMRRYVPAVLPFFIVGGAYLLGSVGLGQESLEASWLSVRWKIFARPVAILAALVTAVWLAGIGWAARGFVSQVDHAGLAEQMDALAGSLPEGAILLFADESPVGQGDVWGTPLRFVYGYDAFALRLPPETAGDSLVEAIKTWQNNGRPVIWIGATNWLDSRGYRYRSEQVILTSARLESSYDHKPQAVITETATLFLSYLESE